MFFPKEIAAIAAFSVASIIFVSAPVRADADETARYLLPLESRDLSVQADPDRFKSAAETINNSGLSEADLEGASDDLDLGFLEEYIDEEGNVNLPLGITVFEAMGTTSVGFGSDF